MGWYVVQTKYKQAELAIVELLQQGYEVYCPRLKERPLFGNYIFVKEHPSWRHINGTRGCSRILCMDPEKPSLVPTKLIEELMRQENEGGFISDLERAFRAGDHLQILDGPLKGHSGTATEIHKNKVMILLHLLGSEIRVSLKASSLALR